MSYYYKYQFTSPESIFAIVKEEFKSYFDSGAVDDLMFPTYVNKCLENLGKTGYDIFEKYLYIDDYQAKLPDNFTAVREAWLCTMINGYPYRSANSFYSQAASEDTIQVSPTVSGFRACTNTECTNDNCDGTECMPVLIQAVYKTNNEVNVSYQKTILLKPGNISVLKDCSFDCLNFGSSAFDSFDIRDNKFVTNFRTGTVSLIYYGNDYDDEGNQLIPDSFEIKEYIEAYLKYKVVETLTNQINDETYNQLERKLNYYSQQADEAFIVANTEIKKQTVYEKMRAIKRSMDSQMKYELPNKSPRSYRSRRGWIS